MGIRFSCPNGHKLNVKAFLAGKRGVCPQCGAKFLIPSQTNSLDSEIGRSNAAGESQSVDVISPIRQPIIDLSRLAVGHHFRIRDCYVDAVGLGVDYGS